MGALPILLAIIPILSIGEVMEQGDEEVFEAVAAVEEVVAGAAAPVVESLGEEMTETEIEDQSRLDMDLLRNGMMGRKNLLWFR
jgi:hypothetical protein